MIRMLAIIGVSTAACFYDMHVNAETLRQALVQTYRTNPSIMAERERVRGLDEGVAVARSGLRPRISATLGLNQELSILNSSERRGLSGRIDVEYPLFNGGRVRNSIGAADARVDAGRASLRAVEGDVLTEAVSVYMDVIRDRAIVALNQNQVRVLETNLSATSDRFEVGDITRTDVAQSEARLALAQSNLATVEGRLQGSEEAYLRVVGTPPGDLEPPPALPRLPDTPDEAVRVALESNSDLRAIADQVRAASFDVEVLRADRLPTLNAVSTSDYSSLLGSGPNTSSNATSGFSIGLAARVPLYQGGLVGARVRQASSARLQLIEQAIELERLVIARARATFATYRAAVLAIRSNEIAVAANQLALEGTRAEQSVGNRTVLDVLNAEQDLLSSEVQLVTARRDAYVAAFSLLNAMGEAEAADLGLDLI